MCSCFSPATHRHPFYVLMLSPAIHRHPFYVLMLSPATHLHPFYQSTCSFGLLECSNSFLRLLVFLLLCTLHIYKSTLSVGTCLRPHYLSCHLSTEYKGPPPSSVSLAFPFDLPIVESTIPCYLRTLPPPALPSCMSQSLHLLLYYWP
jgi:hypothetical protein